MRRCSLAFNMNVLTEPNRLRLGVVTICARSTVRPATEKKNGNDSRNGLCLFCASCNFLSFVARGLRASPKAMSVETHHKFDKTGGVGKAMGLKWFEAARYGNLAIVRQLLKGNPQLVAYHGAGTVYGFVGNSALHWAVSRNDEPMARILLQNGAAVNAQNNGGSTPLHTACAHGHARIVPLLLQHGANPLLVDCCQETASDVTHPAAKGRIRPLLQVFQCRRKGLSELHCFVVDSSDADWRAARTAAEGNKMSTQRRAQVQATAGVGIH